ncbi:hypothetical protein C8Q73DRAFT_689064 [Cubamyces lactineus]|nr:hypothetical protein C8Q73DRAFT_689064 [Cubamyces lactineus]
MLSRFDTLPAISVNKQQEKNNGDHLLAPSLSRSPTELLNEASKQFPDVSVKRVERTTSEIVRELEPDWANWDDEPDFELPEDEQSQHSTRAALTRNRTLRHLATTSGSSQSNDHTRTRNAFSQSVEEWENGPASALEHAPPPAFLSPTLSRYQSESGVHQGDGAEEERMDEEPTTLPMEEIFDIERWSNSRYATPAPGSPPPSSSARTPVRRQIGMDDLRRQFTQDAASLERASSSSSSGILPAAADGHGERPPVAALRRSHRLQGRK